MFCAGITGNGSVVSPAGNRLDSGDTLGNGMIGAMVFGGVSQERIALNESTFWSGCPHNYDNPEAFQYFPQIRDLVFVEKFQEAEKMADDHFWSTTPSYAGPSSSCWNCWWKSRNITGWKAASMDSALEAT